MPYIGKPLPEKISMALDEQQKLLNSVLAVKSLDFMEGKRSRLLKRERCIFAGASVMKTFVTVIKREEEISHCAVYKELLANDV
ncbi:unnamed protein product [Acanthoscelides obtectus]|uniref:Uncharacterized protein n=1 Tax=Acanthoscelides obtectus TaxID=200917 RepID=A0A9P0PYB3_ACAOB|nr:unnamed protein product [Acanthoscelides obtectus]CAK1665031.1 hypothetical protein AOBTE_LOCUS24623 [Acanthoscelides obtectus]